MGSECSTCEDFDYCQECLDNSSKNKWKKTKENNHYFKKINNSKWEEWHDDKLFKSFEERASNDKYILLYDESRNMFVKLKNDYAEISTNGLDNFKRSFDGGWVINH